MKHCDVQYRTRYYFALWEEFFNLFFLNPQLVFLLLEIRWISSSCGMMMMMMNTDEGDVPLSLKKY